MRSWLPVFLIGLVVLPGWELVHAQAPPRAFLGAPETGMPHPPEQPALVTEPVAQVAPIQLAATQPGDKDDKNLSKQVELLRKQVETQQKMIELLADHVRKQPLAGTPVEKLQIQTATLEARSLQVAQRDQGLAQAVDNLTEHLDATERNGPRLPETLKELFLPSRTNQTPLSVYGTIVGGYNLFPHQRGAGKFTFDAFEPRFLLQLNDNIFLVAEPEITADEIELGYANVNFIVNDWLTVLAGRFLPPIGSFNERLHFSPIRKMPDFPVVERTVTPGDFSLNGIEARGAQYLFCSPVKLEYAFYLANGLGLPGKTLSDLANLDRLAETTADVNNAMAFGGRVGLWAPELGLNGGFSLFFNRPYTTTAGNDINLWNIDLNYHKDNWDVRFEYAFMRQETEAFIGTNIHRRGFYAQVAYQPLDASSDCLRKLEFVFRYSRARFDGIDPFALDLGAFASRVRVPVDRDQYAFGVNYHIAPMLIVKFAYEINREHGLDLKDNVFLAQLAWGF
jgi:hypothetical protein